MGDVDSKSWRGKGVDRVLRSAKLFGCCVYFRIGMVVWVMELLLHSSISTLMLPHIPSLLILRRFIYRPKQTLAKNPYAIIRGAGSVRFPSRCKFTQLMSNHLIRNTHRDILYPIMHQKLQSTINSMATRPPKAGKKYPTNSGRTVHDRACVRMGTFCASACERLIGKLTICGPRTVSEM
jgi:hypothetical protein